MVETERERSLKVVRFGGVFFDPCETNEGLSSPFSNGSMGRLIRPSYEVGTAVPVKKDGSGSSANHAV